MAVAVDGLLERERELALIADMLDAARSGAPSALVVRGEAGIGKTTLLRSAERAARAAEMTVLAATGGELEQDFAFGIARQLFEPAVPMADGDEPLLAGAAGLAAPVISSSASAEPVLLLSAPDSAFALHHGLYWLAANISAIRPLLLIVDDAHWADAASLRWLHYLVRRLEGLPIALIVAARSEAGTGDASLLAALVADPAVTTCGLQPLSHEASSELVRGRLGPRAQPDLCRVCHERSNGNPFLLAELAGALANEPERGPAGDVELAGRLGPSSVGAAMLLRLARLPPAASDLITAVAVLERDVRVDHAAAVAGMGIETARAHLDELAEQNFIRAGAPLNFQHPLARDAIYAQVPVWKRSDWHRRACDVLNAAGELERAAGHAILVEPAGDPDIVAVLRDSARAALARGAAEAAVAHLARALREPPSGAERGEVLLELGRAERLAAMPAATEHLEAALAVTTGAHERAFAGAELTSALLGAGRVADALAQATALAEELRRDDPRASLVLEAEAIALLQMSGRGRAERAPELEALERTVSGDSPAGRRLLVSLAFGHLTAGTASAAHVGSLLDRAAEFGSVFVDRESWDHLSPAIPWAITTEIGLDRLDEAWDHATRLLEGGRRLGSAVLVLTGAGFRSRISYLRGDLTNAEVDARISLQAAEAIAPTFYVDFPVSGLTLALVEAAQLDEAQDVLESHGMAGERLPPGRFALHFLLEARLAVWLATGNANRAATDGEVLWRIGRQRGTPPILLLRGLSGQAAPDPDIARDRLDRDVAAAASFGLTSTHAAALRARASVERGPGAVERLEQAVEMLETSPRRLELTRSLLALGIALRRERRRADAAVPLRRALELAASGGAHALANSARSELRLCGLRPRGTALSGVDALTPAERRVAEMVAAGAGNVEVAQRLFVTRRTVETHLSAVYRKLGVSDRRQLAAAMTPDPA